MKIKQERHKKKNIVAVWGRHCLGASPPFDFFFFKWVYSKDERGDVQKMARSSSRVCSQKVFYFHESMLSKGLICSCGRFLHSDKPTSGNHKDIIDMIHNI